MSVMCVNVNTLLRTTGIYGALGVVCNRMDVLNMCDPITARKRTDASPCTVE